MGQSDQVRGHQVGIIAVARIHAGSLTSHEPQGEPPCPAREREAHRTYDLPSTIARPRIDIAYRQLGAHWLAGSRDCTNGLRWGRIR
jgi:hypothetical protein